MLWNCGTIARENFSKIFQNMIVPCIIRQILLAKSVSQLAVQIKMLSNLKIEFQPLICLPSKISMVASFALITGILFLTPYFSRFFSFLSILRFYFTNFSKKRVKGEKLEVTCAFGFSQFISFGSSMIDDRVSASVDYASSLSSETLK